MDKEILNKLRNGVAGLVLLGAGATGLWIYQETIGSTPNPFKFKSPDQKDTLTFKPVSPVLLQELLEKEGAQNLLRLYLIEHGNFESIFSTPLALTGKRLGSLDKTAVQLIQEQAYEHVVNGIFLTNLLAGKPLSTDDKPQIVTGAILPLPDKEFRLGFNANFQFHLAAAWVYAELAAFDSNLGQRPLAKAEKMKEDLVWLVKENPPIKMLIEPGSFAIIPTELLAEMSENLQMLKALNVPYPREIRFKVAEPKDSGGAWYDDEHTNPTNPYRITIANLAGTGAFDHEVAHHLAASWHMPENRNPQLVTFGQESFNQMIERIKQRYRVEGQIIKAKNETEEYAEVFVKYYSQGNRLRRAILGATDGSVQKELLRAEYTFMKTLWGGKEFRSNRQLVEHLDLTVPINIGDVVEISDTDLNTPGIFLRQRPALEITQGLNSVWDGDHLKIIEGPVVVFNDKKYGLIEMWKVQTGFLFKDSRGYYFSGSQRSPEGWISREWFGRTIQTR